MPIDPALAYDPGNIFARILRSELPCNQVYADEWALAFHDIRPQAPVHVLVIRAIGIASRVLELAKPGYRLLVNMGQHGHQEVAHLHVHIFGGRQFFQMIGD